MTPTPPRTLQDRARAAQEKRDRELLLRGKARIFDKLGSQAITGKFRLNEDGTAVEVEVDGLKFYQTLSDTANALFLVRPESNYQVTDLAQLGDLLEERAEAAEGSGPHDVLSESGV